jgi:hypothetical protein
VSWPGVQVAGEGQRSAVGVQALANASAVCDYIQERDPASVTTRGVKNANPEHSLHYAARIVSIIEHM